MGAAQKRRSAAAIPAAWCTGDYFTAPVRAWKQLQFVPQMPHVIAPSVLGRPSTAPLSGVAIYNADQRRMNSGFDRHGLGLGGSTPKPVQNLTERRVAHVRDSVLQALHEAGRAGATPAELAAQLRRSSDSVSHLLNTLGQMRLAGSWPDPVGTAHLRRRWWVLALRPSSAPVPASLKRKAGAN